MNTGAPAAFGHSKYLGSLNSDAAVARLEVRIHELVQTWAT